MGFFVCLVGFEVFFIVFFGVFFVWFGLWGLFVSLMVFFFSKPALGVEKESVLAPRPQKNRIKVVGFFSFCHLPSKNPTGK